MRVIGYISHPEIKITVFETDTRFPVQFEAGGIQQTYKFRKGNGIEKLADIKELVDEPMCTQVMEIMRRQAALKASAIKRQVQRKGKPDFDDLPEIL